MLQWFGPIGRLWKWAKYGAVTGALFAFAQIVLGHALAQGNAYASGRLVGGALVGALFGALLALLRNLSAGLLAYIRNRIAGREG